MIRNEKHYLATKRRLDEVEVEILRILTREVLSHAIYLLSEYELDELYLERATLRRQLDEYDARIHGDRRGQWMPLSSGRRFWPEDPRPSDIDIGDIAHALARTNRFNGHTRGVGYTVAQHSVLISSVLPQSLKLFGLLHDAGECYLGDIITPVKRLLRQFYEPIEEKVMEAVASRFGFTMTPTDKHEVKRADMKLLHTEVRDLMEAGTIFSVPDEIPLTEPIDTCWPTDVAEDVFLTVFEELYEQHKKLCGLRAATCVS